VSGARRSRRPADAAFLTTQPGWAFATLAELRATGVRDYVDLTHRDSTLVLPADALPAEPLLTPADAYGAVVVETRAAQTSSRWDATRALAEAVRRMEPNELQTRLRRWLPSDRRRASWSIGAEVWGDTQVQRRQLRELVAQALRSAFPRWREQPSGGAHFLVKADTRAALLGVQLYSNLGEDEPVSARPGTLRPHLACGLLTLAGCRSRAGAEPGGSVLDPFMGSGTILDAAARHYDADLLVGSDIDRGALRLARERLRGADAEVRVRHSSFDDLDPVDLPAGTRLVSNLPFGARFEQVPTDRLVRFLGRLAPRLSGIALLLGRDQAVEIAGSLQNPALRVKNVLVLGQPAAIAYWAQLRI